MCRWWYFGKNTPKWTIHQFQFTNFTWSNSLSMTIIAQTFQPDTTEGRPLFLQLSDHLIRSINTGLLPPGQQIPSTRRLATELGINRKTTIAAYEDAADQGYLISRVGSGYRVVEALPQRPVYELNESPVNELAGFQFDPTPPPTVQPQTSAIRLTEGAPDVRLADLSELYIEARRLLKRQVGQQLARYGDGQGDLKLRESLARYLATSRGIPATPAQLLITRGSQHAFQLASRLLFRNGGVLAVAAYSYNPILKVAEDFGAEVIRLPLDDQGLMVEKLSNHPRLKDIRAVYVTPHHQYPTTVTLPPARRIQLLDLAEQHRFAIIEDDYDYDFYYDHPPHLPLAAMDRYRNVLYLGSFTKILAPTLRIGYLVGPHDFVSAALYHRLMTDRQGDLLLERALAHYIDTGNLERHLRRVRPIYQERRDLMLQLLKEKFSHQIACIVPSGGMALWVKFSEKLTLEPINSTDVWINETHFWWVDSHCLRLGFASLNEEEMRLAVTSLGQVLVER